MSALSDKDMYNMAFDGKLYEFYPSSIHFTKTLQMSNDTVTTDQYHQLHFQCISESSVIDYHFLLGTFLILAFTNYFWSLLRCMMHHHHFRNKIFLDFVVTSFCLAEWLLLICFMFFFYYPVS